MMNVKNMFVFAVAFLLLSLSYTTSTDGLSLKRVVTTSTNVVNARPVQISDVELSTPSVVRGEPVSVVRRSSRRRVVGVRPTTSSTVDAREVDVELSTPSVVKWIPVAHIVQDLSAQDPVAQDYVEGVPVEGVPVVDGQKPESWLRRNKKNTVLVLQNVVLLMVGVGLMVWFNVWYFNL